MKLFSRKNKIYLSEKNSGFTLVETLVAVSIFSISIAAMISVVASGVGNTTTVKNRIIGNRLFRGNKKDVKVFQKGRKKIQKTEITKENENEEV